MTIENPIAQMSNVSKRFGKIQALDNIDLEIRRGGIVGLLGANGSGKSTLMRHIVGLYLADRGRCVTFETDAAKLTPKELGRIGYVHQEGELIDWMTVEQMINYVSAYYKTWNYELQDRYINDFDVSLDDRIGSLSPGQRQKAAILLAICFEPELLILDEPASTLDPIARNKFLDLLLQIIQNKNSAVIISSHILSDVEKVIDHTLIMQKGTLLRDCSLDALREEFIRFTLTSLNGQLPAELSFENVISCQTSDKKAFIIVQNDSRENLEDRARTLNCQIEFRPLSLEELYSIVVN